MKWPFIFFIFTSRFWKCSFFQWILKLAISKKFCYFLIFKNSAVKGLKIQFKLYILSCQQSSKTPDSSHFTIRNSQFFCINRFSSQLVMDWHFGNWIPNFCKNKTYVFSMTVIINAMLHIFLKKIFVYWLFFFFQKDMP